MADHHKRIIIGATSSGLGAFLSEPSDTLLIEQSSMIGQDFASTFWPGSVDISEPKDMDPIFKEAIERNIIENGKVHLPGLHTLFYSKLKPYSKQFLLLTEIISVNKTTSIIEVEVYNKNGFKKFTCEELIDATSLMITNQNKTEVTESSIGCVFIANNKEVQLPNFKDAVVYPSRFNNEFYLHLPIKYTNDWAKIRWDVVEFIRSNKEELKDWSLASIANYLYVKVKNNYLGAAFALNPSQYNSIYASFEAGKHIQFAGAKS